MQEDKYISFMKKCLSEKRIAHSFRVANTATYLAKLYNVSEEMVYIAGILHDVGKGVSPTETITMLNKNKYQLTEDDLQVPEVLHAPLSAIIANQDLGISNSAILQAITRHTTGDKAMTVMDAIIYVADMIEPFRDYPGVQELRKSAENDLYTALVTCLGHTIKYLVSKGKIIHPRTIQTYNWLLQSKKLQA